IRRVLLMCFIVCISVMYQGTVQQTTVHAFSPQVIQHGAVGEDVIELQARLQHIGFYHGDIDGVFGWTTYWALRNFQYEFGMEVDGLAGKDTKEKLVKATKYDPQKVKQKINQASNTGNKGGGNGGESNTSKKPQPTGKNVPKGYSEND